MKKNSAPKKLGLSKETLTVLGQQSLADAKGGATPVILPIIAISLAVCDDIYEYLVDR